MAELRRSRRRSTFVRDMQLNHLFPPIRQVTLGQADGEPADCDRRFRRRLPRRANGD
jgi:hypothetical protein